MKIIAPYESPYTIHGALRALLAVMDICKTLDHNVTILFDRDADRETPGATITKHYGIENIGDYYPLRTLKTSDFEKARLYGLDGYERYIQADLVWTFSGTLDRIEHHVEKPPEYFNNPFSLEFRNHWSYQHFPVSGDYPHPSCVLHANSTYTQKAIKMRWGKPSRLLHPPIPLDRYTPERSFEERETDLIYIGRVDPLKLGSPTIFKRMPELRTLIVGAEHKGMFPDYEPDITWVKNATFTILSKHLSNSKVYVHWKYFFDRVPEHYGLVVAEAMASGIPTIVPKAGGPWTDISDFGKYAIGVRSVEEAIKEVHRLLEDRDYWAEWSNKAVEGVKRLGYETATAKVKNWLNELSYTEGNQKVNKCE